MHASLFQTVRSLSAVKDGQVRQRSGQSGYILITLGLFAIVLVGSIGLAVDLGTAYIARNECQSFADAASLSAALELDGTDLGIAAARQRALSMPNRWGFGNRNFGAVSVEFSTAPDGPWSNAPASAAEVRFARVSVTAASPMVFLPLVVNDNITNVAGSAVAGQVEKDTFTNGVFPYSPFTHDDSGNPEDAQRNNFGFAAGTHYTLRWPNNMNKHAKPCDGDKDDADVLKKKEDAGESVQGYIDSNSAADIREAIIGSTMHNDRVYTVGTPLFMANGNKQSEETAMQARVLQDGNTTSTTYAEYSVSDAANGRRLVVVPVNSGPSDNFRIQGFALFFLLPPDAYKTKPADSFCAEYVGPAVMGGNNQGGGSEPGAYSVRLVR